MVYHLQNNMETPTITIFGKIPSKSNNYKVIRICGHYQLGKTAILKKYEKSFAEQCRCAGMNIDEPFRLDVDVYFENNRPDLDNSFKILLDCMQTNKVITNDRHCMQIVANKHVDKDNPRIEFKITTL